MIRAQLKSGALQVAFALTALGTVATAVSAQEYRPAFHPDALKGPPPGKPNEVMVLGTSHLSGLPKTFQPEMLTPLLERLETWRPTAIATEDMSGLQCDSLRRYPARYAETVKTYCFDPSIATLATGLDVPAANVAVEKVLADWPTHPTSGQRRHLAALFLAAGERGSALVQWLRLPEQDRKEDGKLNAELVALLDTLKDKWNETYLIAAPLAAKLGLERLWSVDDHSADSPDPADAEGYATAIEGAWDNEATKARIADDTALQAQLSQPGGILTMYRSYNAPLYPMLAYQSDFGAALMEPSPQAYGRGYVGYWETRNLRMVANMRDIIGQKPGTRMLAIVGASHKGYYEAYLNQMHDVHLVDPMTVLE